LHGGHVVDQKFTTTGRPAYADGESSPPSSVGPESLGIAPCIGSTFELVTVAFDGHDEQAASEVSRAAAAARRTMDRIGAPIVPREDAWQVLRRR
jgi:hypothetical protein